MTDESKMLRESGSRRFCVAPMMDGERFRKNAK
jgi:hypothetical protein